MQPSHYAARVRGAKLVATLQRPAGLVGALVVVTSPYAHRENLFPADGIGASGYSWPCERNVPGRGMTHAKQALRAAQAAHPAACDCRSERPLRGGFRAPGRPFLLSTEPRLRLRS